jgi:multicomponent Na+:H+ antiporter subunit F
MIPAADTPIGFALHFALVCLSLAYFAALYRLLKGPTIPDRIIVIDLVASATIGIILTFIILTGKTIYINVALVIALIVFMGNVAFAKYLKKTVCDD